MYSYASHRYFFKQHFYHLLQGMQNNGQCRHISTVKIERIQISISKSHQHSLVLSVNIQTTLLCLQQTCSLLKQQWWEVDFKRLLNTSILSLLKIEDRTILIKLRENKGLSFGHWLHIFTQHIWNSWYVRFYHNRIHSNLLHKSGCTNWMSLSGLWF